MTGYMHPDYADSFSEFGKTRELPGCGGRILERQIPSFPYKDGMGCYPFFLCKKWSLLESDLKEVKKDLVSLALVTDPFGNYNLDILNKCFEKVVLFKDHFIVNLSYPISSFVSKSHFRYSQKALRNVSIEVCDDPLLFFDDWIKMYAFLIKKHGIKGITAFSKEAFAKQFRVPGLVMFRAECQGSTVGINLWFIQENVGYFHLGASTDKGYELRVSYALFWFAIEYFTKSLQWLNFGAGAGIKSDDNDGLSQFKRGFSMETRPVYFCGRIFNKKQYSEIVKAKCAYTTDYFPAYRQNEFG